MNENLTQYLEYLIYFINIIFITSFIVLLARSQKNAILFRFFYAGLGAKLVCSVLFGLLYKYYYQNGDTFIIFSDASSIAKILIENPKKYLGILFLGDFSGIPVEYLHSHFIWQSATLLMSRILSVFCLLSDNNYWLVGIYLAVFSYIPVFMLANKLADIFPNAKNAAAIAFLGVPSVVFWSSGVCKETLLLPFICILGDIFMRNIYVNITTHSPSLKEKEKEKERGVFTSNYSAIFKDILLAMFCFLIIWKLKYYYAGVLLICMLSFLINLYLERVFLKKIYQQYPSLSYFMVVFLMFIILFPAGFLHWNLQLDNIMGALVQNHDQIYKIKPQDAIQFNNLKVNWSSLLENTPLAMFSGLFRIFLWESKTFLQALAGAENLLILGLFVASLVRWWQNGRYFSTLIFVILIYITVLATMLALSSPNFGTLSRYKVGFVPFEVYLMLLVFYQTKVNKET